eukprot:3568609-Prorocentrum_lima.AAC.1
MQSLRTAAWQYRARERPPSNAELANGHLARITFTAQLANGPLALEAALLQLYRFSISVHWQPCRAQLD